MTAKPPANVGGSTLRSLADFHGLVDAERTTGPGYHLSARIYPTGDVEIVARRLQTDDALNRGGGATRKARTRADSDPEVLAKNQQRARTQIRRKILSMQADRLLTLTFRENVTDLDPAYKCFAKFNRLMRWRFGKRWGYVCVPEFQQRGAVHFHLAVHGYYPVNTVRALWLKAVGEFGGNIDITSPRNAKKQSWNPRRIAQYLAKYISKSEVAELNKKRYASGGAIVIPAPLRGWLALGVSVGQIIGQILPKLTRKPASVYWESPDVNGIIYVST